MVISFRPQRPHNDTPTSAQPPSMDELDECRREGLRPQVVCCGAWDKKVLLAYDAEFDLWQLPQGGIERGETWKDALYRELEEELGANFRNACSPSATYLGRDRLYFRLERANPELEASVDTRFKGKQYFVFGIPVLSPGSDVDNSLFEDFRWCSLEQAKALVRPQKGIGKRRVTLRALELLRSGGMLR